MAKVFSGTNPSQLYLDAMVTTILEGDELAPRGKKIKEIQPAVVEFLDPTQRITFLRGRKLNPFFHLAEGLWMMLGRADVDWLVKYNRNMETFSDDGVFYNASYGERLRKWGVNSAAGYIHNPIDQLYDVYRKLKADPDTRQAFATIGNPRFDGADYTLAGGKDIACNREIYFKIRKGKLNITVPNRSNDVHWGLFTANLGTFGTYQEMMASWLGLEVGKYSQMTDSLHIYLEDYGSKITAEILKAYGIDELTEDTEIPQVEHFTFENEPRMLKLEPEKFDEMLRSCERVVEELIHVDDNVVNEEIATGIQNIITAAPDAYLKTTLLAMLAYRGHRLAVPEVVFSSLALMPDCQWKLSCLYFLYNSYSENPEFTELYDHYTDAQKAYIEGN